MSADFAQALERAIALERGAVQRNAVFGGLAGVGLGVYLYFDWSPLLAPLPVVLLLVAAAAQFAGSKTIKGLSGLRGGEPALWLPSTSHGVLVAGDTFLVGGRIPRTSFDRHELPRVTSIAYDEEAHAITVFITRIVKDSDGDTREKLSREDVRLDTRVSPEQAFAFAKELRGRSDKEPPARGA